MPLTNAEKQAAFRARKRSLDLKRPIAQQKIYQAQQIVNRLLHTRHFDDLDAEFRRLERLLNELEETQRVSPVLT